MFLRCNRRRKDGKEHYYWNIVENKRVSGGRVVQRQVLYLGEINDSQHEAWRKSIEIFEEGRERPEQVALFPEDRAPPVGDESIVRIEAVPNPLGFGTASSISGAAKPSQIRKTRMADAWCTEKSLGAVRGCVRLDALVRPHSAQSHSNCSFPCSLRSKSMPHQP